MGLNGHSLLYQKIKILSHSSLPFLKQERGRYVEEH